MRSRRSSSRRPAPSIGSCTSEWSSTGGRRSPVMMASRHGGAWRSKRWPLSEPEAILYEDVDPRVGLEPYQGRRLAARLGLPNENIGGVRPARREFRSVVPRRGLLAGRDESPGPDGRRKSSSLSMPRSTSTTTRSTVTRRILSCETSTRKMRWRCAPLSSISRTSTWTGTSAAWSTAPDWPWPPWTSSRFTAASRRTSSM